MIKYFDEIISEISKSLNTINEFEFNRLIDDSIKTLKSNGKIIVSGLGKNVPICEKFVGSMISMGLNAYFLHTNSAVHGDMGIVKDGDLVIILTKSGETVESIYLAKHLKDRNIKLWLLTFNYKSTLTSEIDNNIILDLENEGDMWNVMPNNSTTINLIVLQALAMKVARDMNIQLTDFKQNHPGGHIGEILK